MHKKLTRTGNSVAVVLDKEILQTANILPDTQVEISASDGAILLTPVRDPDRIARFRAATERVNMMYAGAFARLAK